MHNPAITVITLLSGAVVQTAGVDTPVETQVENLTEAGRLNRPPVPGAARGEVWTRGRVVTTTFFDPDEDASARSKRQADEEAAAAEAKRKADEEAAKTTPSQGSPPGGGEAHNLEQEGSTPSPATNSTPPEQGAEGTPGSAPGASAPGTSPPPVSGRKK